MMSVIKEKNRKQEPKREYLREQRAKIHRNSMGDGPKIRVEPDRTREGKRRSNLERKIKLSISDTLRMSCPVNKTNMSAIQKNWRFIWTR